MRIIVGRYRRSVRLRLNQIYPGIAAVLLTAVLLRAFFTSGMSVKLEDTLHRAGESPSFVQAVLNFELKGTLPVLPGSDRLQTVIASESTVLSAFAENLRAASGTNAEEVYVLPEDKELPTIEIRDPSDAAPPVENGEAGSGDPPTNIIPVTISPKSESGYDYFGGVYIKNETSMTIDVEKALANQPNLSMSGEGPQVLIIHTHTSEAYTPDEKDNYTPTDTERTEDPNFNMVRVGEAIKEVLEAKGISVIHNTELHDYPSYSGSYTRTLADIEEILKANPTISVVIDVHRDAMITDDGSIYRTVTEIDGTDTAQVMLVMGTGEDGLPHENWKDNLRLAVRIQKKMADTYPTLARPLNLRTERFNQHATNGSMLVEIGTTGNTMQEALAGARLFAECAADVLLQYKQ